MHSSRKPRRAFAAPLVITAAALPACIVSSTPSSKPATVTTHDHRTDGDDATADHPQTVPHTNPPRPTGTDPNQTNPDQVVGGVNEQPQGDPPGYQRNWSVALQDDGTCLATMVVACKKGQSCNPPRPTAVECPKGITADGPMSIYAASGSWDCYITPPETKCPEKATCNPPPPRQTACPK